MEYDILNEIITSTVGQLFNPGKKQAPDTDNASWVQVEGPRRLQESMTRLRMDAASTQGRDLPTRSLEDLLLEKRKVKRELKNYDQSFMSQFGRLPTREEKEPMRPLYMFYKKLKQAISRKQQERPPAASTQASTSMEQTLAQLTRERNSLREKLHKYQHEFFLQNHRRIRYHRDIAAVEGEYKRYKEVKAEIARLEGRAG